MNYCAVCGSANVAFKPPPGDARNRHVCQDCGEIFYENPKIIAGCILEWDERILLCKRAIEPRCGLWTIPAGFMENHESVVEAAIREATEEACATPTDLQLHGIYNLKHVSQVYMVYRGGLKDGRAEAGEETSDVGLYRKHEIPWERIAFVVVREALERYFDDRESGEMRLHGADMDRDDGGRIKVSGRDPVYHPPR